MKTLTLLPGCLLLLSAALGFYVGLGGFIIWGIMALSAVGTMATAALLWREVPRTAASTTQSHLVVGFLAYPLLTALTTGILATIWYGYLSTADTATCWAQFIGVVSIFTTVLAVELATTAIPASMSMLCRQFATEWNRQHN